MMMVFFKNKVRIFILTLFLLLVSFRSTYSIYNIYKPDDKIALSVAYTKSSLCSLFTQDRMIAVYKYNLSLYEEKKKKSWRYFFISNFTWLGLLEKFFDSVWIVFLNKKICEAQKIAFDGIPIKFLDIFIENRRYYFSGDYFYWPERFNNYETCSDGFYTYLEEKQYIMVKYHSKYFLVMGMPLEIEEYISNLSENFLQKEYQNFTVSYFDPCKSKKINRGNR